MPHKPVVSEGATSAKVRMVFDASSIPSREAYSFNECMNPVLEFTEVQRNIHHLGSHAYKREQNSNTNKTIGLNIKD